MPESSSLTHLLSQAEQHTKKDIDLGLSRIERLFDSLHNPQQGLQIIHIAGSNGKGSVAAFLAAILQQAGIRVGLYTSPHLQRFNERIQIANQPISDGELTPILQLVLDICNKKAIPATFFEITTAVALFYFKQQGLARGGGNPGIVILETGLGGRLDATNATTPLLCLITAIDQDHGEYLGDSIEQIAAEKAGILKPGIPAAAAPNHPKATAVLQDRAKAIGVDLAILGKDFSFTPPAAGSTKWRFSNNQETITLPRPALLGDHQLQNGALAVAGVDILKKRGWDIPTVAIQLGIATAKWPGRLEWFYDCFPQKPSPDLLLDGAHNLHAVQALVSYLTPIVKKDGPCNLIFSALKNKDAQAMCETLAPVVERVWTVAVGGKRGMDTKQLSDLWQPLNIPATPCSTPLAALELASTTPNSGKRILVAGSLYLVGEVRSLL